MLLCHRVRICALWNASEKDCGAVMQVVYVVYAKKMILRTKTYSH